MQRMTTLPRLDNPSRLAIFVDFDGTLVEIAERPERVVLAARTRAALAALDVATGGAVAIVTGRDIVTVDGFLAPLRLPVAGVHGLTRRDASGHTRAPVDTSLALAQVAELLAPLLRQAPELLAERKSAAIALHYRARPDLEGACIATMRAIVSLLPELHIKTGKMVVEVKLGSADKGTAVREFMQEEPFAGRQPFFAGDDVTDEDAFAVVNAMSGTTIKIGHGPSLAAWRASTTVEFLDWLYALAEQLSMQRTDHHANQRSGKP